MFSSSQRFTITIPPFHHDSAMRYGKFVPRLYNLCRSLGFTPGKIMPSRAFCSDENQGYPVIELTKHFGTFPFNHGRAGGIISTDRHEPHAHHGKDLLILQASHVGYDPDTQQFGVYRRSQKEHEHCSPTCGKINSIVSRYQEEHRFAADNILLRRKGEEFQITIDNQLLKETRQEGLFLKLEQFIATHGDGSLQLVQVHSTSKTFRLTSGATERIGAQYFSEEGSRIDTRLPADWFYYKRNLANVEEGQQHLDHNLFNVMQHIVTAPAPLLTAAHVNTMVEFDRAFRTIVKNNAYHAQKVIMVSGINIDISPTSERDRKFAFPLTKFLPWAAYYKDEHGNGQIWEKEELFERLAAQPIENPDEINLEDAIALMFNRPDIDIVWPS